MTDPFDLGAELSAGLRHRAAAWRFVRRFAQHWVAPLGDRDGCTDAELDEAERRLGVALPVGLREAYRLLGQRVDLTSNHDVLLSPAELYVDDAKEALVFREENQGAVSWGVLLDDLAEADPAVSIRADLADRHAERWEPWLGRLSVAFVEIVLSESLQGPEGLHDFLDGLDQDGADELERHFTPLPFPAYPVGEEETGSRWFTGPDVLLREDGGMAVLLRARTAAALDAVRDRVGGDWLYA